MYQNSTSGLGFVTAAAAAPLAAAGPVGWIALGITAALPFIGKLFTRGQDTRKVAATQAVDAAERELKQNLADYMAGPRTSAAQSAALARFDQVWASVVAYCSNPELAGAGVNCIADRERTGRWPWAAYYRDPIAADTPTDSGSWSALLANPDQLMAQPANYTWLLGAGLVVAGVLL